MDNLLRFRNEEIEHDTIKAEYGGMAAAGTVKPWDRCGTCKGDHNLGLPLQAGDLGILERPGRRNVDRPVRSPASSGVLSSGYAVDESSHPPRSGIATRRSRSTHEPVTSRRTSIVWRYLVQDYG